MAHDVLTPEEPETIETLEADLARARRRTANVLRANGLSADGTMSPKLVEAYAIETELMRKVELLREINAAQPVVQTGLR